MPIISQERFVEIVTGSADIPADANPWDYQYNKHIRRQIQSAAAIDGARLRGQINRESALGLLASIREFIGVNGWLNAKLLRPWEIDDQLYDNLDRTEAWWGFEFETGWDGAVSRQNAIHHTWDTWDNVCFDSEGEGNSAVEITFAPCERSKYMDGTAPAYQFAEFLCASPNTHRGAYDAVGTHINISHPDLDATATSAMCAALNRTIAHLPRTVDNEDVRRKFFGRSDLYGGFFIGQGEAAWVEGKIFRTTYDMDEFKKYIVTSEVLTKCLEALLKEGVNRGKGRATPFVANMYEMLTEDAEADVRWSDRIHIDGTRGNGLLNTGLTRDLHDVKFLENPEDGRIVDDAYYGDDDDDDDDYDEPYDAEEHGVWCDECEEYH